MAVASPEDALRSPGPFRLVAQLSDPHIVEAGALCMDRIDTAGFLRRALETLSQLRPGPELLLCSGDLVNDGRPEQYAHLRELLSGLAFPVHLMCGNHDDRAALRAAFPDHHYLGVYGPCDYVVDALEPLRLIALDTMVANTASGQLSADQLHWLDRQLAAGPEQPTLVAMHHPPFATGIAHMDAMGLEPRAARALADVLRRHPQVERVLCGHLHRSITHRFANTVACVVPSCAHAIGLDLGAEDDAGSWTEEPPAVALHLWSEPVGVVTHLRTIGHFPAHRFGPADPEGIGTPPANRHG